MEELYINYWSHGPHYQFHDSIVFITWRLAGTLPVNTMKLFKQLKATDSDPGSIRDLELIRQENARLFRLYQQFDLELAKWQNPGFSLNDEALAKIITDAIHFYAGTRYELHAYCVMSNHVHLLLRALKRQDSEYHYISDIVQALKRYTALQINRHLGKEGQLWDDYYFDRIIRDEMNYNAVVEYILMNPVKAGLVSNSELWRDSYYYLGNKYG
jgi:REP element-mobilizing transposase RayT